MKKVVIQVAGAYLYLGKYTLLIISQNGVSV